MADFHPLEYAGKHPITVGAVVFAGGLALLYLTGAFSNKQSAGGSNAADVQGYFAAESAQAQAGDAVDIAAINAQASTQQAYLNDNANMNINSTWATAQTSMNAANNQATIAEAPFAATASIAGALGNIAAQPPTTVTSTKSSNGFFGIGGGSSTTTRVIPNPNAGAATDALAGLLSEFAPSGGASTLNAGH